ncbi:NADH pyrophosphatase [Rhodovulum sp. P5]|uniref:NAD(+) diphosphatase n=1 Tax=Rhodovulum sp. P5 TaxID=1564506 RepID=UPI0009C3D558|nr:NAD(+) diphosphatase [Rhodovulum sp. P5]ARE39396.1 NADH pyrophosphatase [Rhodovulum sp. P5]
MRLAEQVTFGGGGLDRAAAQRVDDAALARLWQAPGTGVLLCWRGKPLVDAEGLGWLPGSQPVVAPLQNRAIFLGRTAAGDARFAADLSHWQPEDAPENPDSFLDISEQHHPGLPASHVFAELRREMTRLTPVEAECAATAKALLGWHRSHRFCARCGAESVMEQAGWQRRCPACGAHHFPRTDPVVIMLITRGNSVLLGRSPGWPDGMYSLLAGFVEPGETVEAAVRREVAEETGVAVGAVSYLSSQPWPFPASLMIGCHGTALSHEITPDPAEIEDALWLTREDVLAVFAGESSIMKPPRQGAIAGFLLRMWLADKLD